MKARGAGPVALEKRGLRSLVRRTFLLRSAALAAAGLFVSPWRLFAFPQSPAGSAAAPPQKPPAQKPLTVEQKVTEIIVEQLSVDEKQVVPAARLHEDLGTDSLDVVELTMEMEEAFDLELSDDQCGGWKTVADVVQTVRAELDKKKAPAHTPGHAA
jgi:acyl carrier protein